MRVRFRYLAAALSVPLAALWVLSMTRRAMFVVDGRTHPTVGSGGIGVAWSRRDASGVIRLDLRGAGPMARVSFTSVNGYRGGGGMIPELSGTAFIGVRSPLWLPWTDGGASIRLVFIPLWPALPVALVAGVLCWRAWRTVAPGHCVRCRYDLRSLPEGTRCPECGFAASVA